MTEEEILAEAAAMRWNDGSEAQNYYAKRVAPFRKRPALPMDESFPMDDDSKEAL